MKQTRQAVRAIRQSILLRCLWMLPMLQLLLLLMDGVIVVNVIVAAVAVASGDVVVFKMLL
jgi:hypothetical protein